MNLTFHSSHPSVTVFCLGHSFRGRASEQQGLAHTCGHIHTNTPDNSLSLPWAVSVSVWTHKTLVGPAPHRARPYIYPTLPLRVTNMGMGRREGVTQLSAHYVEWSLHSYDCLCDCCPNKYLPLHFCPKPGWLNAKWRPTPLSAARSDRVAFLYLFIILHCPPLILCEVRLSWTHCPVSISPLVYPSLYIFSSLKSGRLIEMSSCLDIPWAQHIRSSSEHIATDWLVL